MDRMIRRCVLVFILLPLFYGCPVIDMNNNEVVEEEIPAGKVLFSGNLQSMSTQTTMSDQPALIDQIMSISFTSGIYQDNLRQAVSSDVEDDGTFSILVDSSFPNCILLLIDSTAPKHEQLVGYLSIEDVNEYLMSVPVADAEPEVDVGSVTVSGEEAVSSMTLNEASSVLNVSTEVLREKARVDDVLKYVRNLYLNYSFEDDFLSCEQTLGPRFAQPLSLSGEYTNNESWQCDAMFLYIVDNAAGFSTTVDDLLSEATVLEIIPPYNVGGNPFPEGSEFVEFSSDFPATTIACGDASQGDYHVIANNYMAIEYDDITRQPNSIQMALQPQLSYAKGDWIITRNGVEWGRFDIGYSSPLDTEGHWKSYVPAIRVVTDGEGYVTHLDIQWNYFDSSSGVYRSVTDIDAFLANLDYCGISIVRSPYLVDGQEDRAMFDNVGDYGFSLDQNDFGDTWVGTETQWITLFYRVFGIDYIFELQNA